MKRLLSALLSVAIIFSSVGSVNALDIIIEEVEYVVSAPKTADIANDGNFSDFCNDLLNMITDTEETSGEIGVISDTADVYLSDGQTVVEDNIPEILIVKSAKAIDTLDAVAYVGGYGDLYFLQFEDYDDLYKAYDYYSALSYVEFVQIDGTVTESVIDEGEEVFTEATVYSSTQYMSDFFGYTDAKSNMGTNEVVVAVVDSGVQHDHERLVGRVEPTGFDAVNNVSCYDDRGHGTHVAGIIVANTRSNVKIRPYKVLDKNGESTDTALYLGIMAAVEDDVDIINLSLTKKGDSDIIHEAVIAAYEADITVVAAAGNNGENLADSTYSPASFPEVICTVAIDSTKYKASYSNWNSTKDLSAPGTDILSTYLNNTYKVMSGTSMACPFMTSCVAYLLADDDTLTPDVVYNTLLNNTKRGAGTHNIKYVTPGTLAQSTTTCAVPVFNFAPGIFSGYLEVSLSCSTPDAEIVYRTADMPEKTYLSYTGPITITETTSFTAYAFAKGYKDSTTSSAKYTLSNQDASWFTVNDSGKLTNYTGSTTRLTIPDYHNDKIITGIASGVFGSLPKLSSLTCGSYVTYIESGAFDGCTQFETLNAPSITVLENGLLDDSPIKSLTITSVTDIPAEYFMNNSTLTTLKITAVTSIGDKAFYATTALTSITASALKTIGSEAFAYSSITKLDAKNTTQIGDYAFKNSNLSSATFNSASSLGIGVFENCTLLLSASIGGTKSIPDYIFHNCTKLQSFSLSRATNVGYKAFYNCTSLTKCSFPSATNILFDESTFENCTALRYVQIPCLFDIAKRMFKNCVSLTDIRVGSSTSSNYAAVDDIGEEGLYGCKLITIDNFNLSGANSLGKNCLVGTAIADTVHKELLFNANVIYEGGFNGIRCERVYFIGLDYLYDIPDNSKIVALDYYLQEVNLTQDLDTEAIFFAEAASPLNSYCNENNLHFEIYTESSTAVRTLRDVDPVCYGEGYTISFEAVAWESRYQWYGCNNVDRSDKVELPSQKKSTLNIYDFLQEYPDYQYTYYFCVVSTYELSLSTYHHYDLNMRTYSSLCQYDPDPNNSIAGSLVGTENTVIDYAKQLVITDSIDNINTINNIFSVTSSNVLITPSHNNFQARGYGTGTVIKVYDLKGTSLLKTMTLVVKGDINGDGVIDALDASQIALYSNKKGSTDVEYIQCAADLDGSGHVDVQDYQAIVNKVVA